MQGRQEQPARPVPLHLVYPLQERYLVLLVEQAGDLSGDLTGALLVATRTGPDSGGLRAWYRGRLTAALACARAWHAGDRAQALLESSWIVGLPAGHPDGTRCQLVALGEYGQDGECAVFSE